MFFGLEIQKHLTKNKINIFLKHAIQLCSHTAAQLDCQ